MKKINLLKEFVVDSSLAEHGTTVSIGAEDFDIDKGGSKFCQWSMLTFGEYVNRAYMFNPAANAGEYIAFYCDSDIPKCLPDIVIIREGNICPIILYYLG